MKPSLEVKRKFIKSLKADGFQVKTDTGWSPIKKCHKTVKYQHWELVTTRHKITCADTHIVFHSNELNEVLDEVFVKDLKIGDWISTKDGYDTVTDVKQLDEYSNMYDLELDDENHRYYTSDILSHNSITTMAYLLWYGMFHRQKKIVVLANKLNLAQEQLGTLKDAYLQLPYWLQPGVKTWNKRSVKFSHESTITAYATSPDTVRGLAVNLAYIDEFAFVKPHLADEFIASVFPTIVAGKTTKMIITSTPFGLNHFFRLWENAKGADVEKTGGNGFERIDIPWNAVPGRDEKWAKEEMERIGEIRFLQEYKCQFIGSVSTLIDHNFLKELTEKDPLKLPRLPEYVRIWELPRKKQELDAKNWEYVASLDSGYGMHSDYTVLQIFLVKSNITAHQVAVMSSNSMDIDDFCKKARPLLTHYHDPGLIIEQNGPGIAATNFFHLKAEYENLLHFDPKGKHMGMWATDKLKDTACILLKTYVQRKFLKLHDEDTIFELHSFGRTTKTKWGGLGGNNDDHVTSIYWIAYYLQSPLFYGNIVEINIKKMSEDEIILGTEQEKIREREMLSRVKDPRFHQEELENGAKYLSEEAMPLSDVDEEDSVNSNPGLFFRH